jgi:hypothetical protein
MQPFFIKTFLLLSGLIIGTITMAQQANPVAIASGGASSKAIAGYTIDCTVGEVVIATVGKNPICTQGIHQAYSDADYPKTGFTLAATAGDKNVLLAWKTTAEINNAWFFIERSTDGIVFKVIDSVRSLALGGNSSAPLLYHYVDQQPAQGTNHYRLRQVSLNGLISYSNTVQVSFVISNWFVQVYPNPVQTTLHVKLYIDKPTMVKYMLYTATGQQLLIQTKQYAVGYHDETFNVSGLRSGMYVIAVRELFTDRRLNVKVFKQ